MRRRREQSSVWLLVVGALICATVAPAMAMPELRVAKARVTCDYAKIGVRGTMAKPDIRGVVDVTLEIEPSDGGDPIVLRESIDVVGGFPNGEFSATVTRSSGGRCGWFHVRGEATLRNWNTIPIDVVQPQDGSLDCCHGVIGDFVWLDLDRDGVQDAGEPGIEGVRVVLVRLEDGQVRETTTAADGSYLFDRICPTEYTVDVDESTLPPGLRPTEPNVGNDALDSDGPLDGSEVPVTIFPPDCEDLTIDFGYVSEEPPICIVLIDEDGIDNGTWSVERAAESHNVDPAYLVNDDRPTEIGNPFFRWNEEFPGDIVLIPTGEVDDEGWFALPEDTPWSVDDFVEGIVPQDQLDKIADVMPLRNQDLVQLVGRTCTAVVYDSDISMNYEPINANLQGERYGLFSFTVLAVELPGSIPESGSSTSLYDLWLFVEPPLLPSDGFLVPIHDHEPDSIEITRARYSNGELTVYGESDFGDDAVMTVSVDGSDAGTDPETDPFVLEAEMVYNSGANRYEFVFPTATNLDGRRVCISTDHGGAYNEYIE